MYTLFGKLKVIHPSFGVLPLILKEEKWFNLIIIHPNPPLILKEGIDQKLIKSTIEKASFSIKGSSRRVMDYLN